MTQHPKRLVRLVMAGIVLIAAGYLVSLRFGGPRVFFSKIKHRIASAGHAHKTAAEVPEPEAESVTVTIDANANRHPISPYIYGMGMAPYAYVADLNLALNRWGGNDKSRYNWTLGNAENAARDWEWRNRPATKCVPPGPSSAADLFISTNRASGAATLLTIPTIGWVARDSDFAHASTGVPEAGGVPIGASDGAISGYDPAQNRATTSVRSLPRKPGVFQDAPNPASGVVYQDEWVRHLVSRFGAAGRGGVTFYAMDNEPDLWDHTHTDIHPGRMGYDSMLSTFLDYADAVKAVDPTAWVTGPVSWGWPGYKYSALDRGDDNFGTHADSTAHGGGPFLLWFLKSVREHDAKAGRRTLDVLDIHYYPQGDGIYGRAEDTGAQNRRLRATRSLWDRGYTDESWIGEPVALIPRMKDWIAAGYPGTQIGISEWNFGSDGKIDGALAIADTLGIYGREGVFLANYWAFPPLGSPGYLAFKLLRNPGGAGDGFGDISVNARSTDSPRVPAYAAVDGRTGELTILLLNKMRRAVVTAPVILARPLPGRGIIKGWRLDAANPRQIVALPAAGTDGHSFTAILPPWSATLYRITVPGAH